MNELLKEHGWKHMRTHLIVKHNVIFTTPACYQSSFESLNKYFFKQSL